MKQISAEELLQIKTYLLQKPFKYEEVLDEVLDHYASAYEASEEPLTEVIERLDEDFSNSKIERMNASYFNELRKQLRKTHFSLFLGNFRWPALVRTLLIGCLFYLVAPLFLQYTWVAKGLFLIFALTPILLGLFFYLKWVRRRVSGKTKLKNAHAEFFGMAVGFTILYAQLPTFGRLLGNDQFKLLDVDPLLTAGVLFIGLILAVTSIQMTLLKFRPAI